MSRSYLVRGTAKWKARKWYLGGARQHQKLRSYAAGIIAHRFFNVPCRVEGKALIVPNPYRDSHGKAYSWDYHWNSHEDCLQPYFESDIVKALVERFLKQNMPHAALPIWYHPYAHPKWHGDKVSDRTEKKSERRQTRIELKRSDPEDY